MILRIFNNQVTKPGDSCRVTMWNDSPSRHTLSEGAQEIEFHGSLFSVQKPIHIRVLDEPEKRFAGTDRVDSRRILGGTPRREKIDYSEGPLLRFKSCPRIVQCQETLFPAWSESW